jgi:hypothetical protein
MQSQPSVARAPRPRMMIAVIFVLEVVWIVFLLVYLSIAFVGFAFLKP